MSHSIRCYQGGQWWEVPDWVSLSLGYDMLLPGTLTGTYAINGINADKLVADAILQATWKGTEGPESRWIIQGGSGSTLPVDNPSFEVIGKSLKDVLRRVIVRHTTPYKPKLYENRKVGYILNDLFTAAQARGAMTGLTWDFSATVDSDGVAWADTIEKIEFPPGTKYSELTTNFIENGYLELQVNGTVINAYNFGGQGSIKTSTIELAAGKDYEETPFRWTTEERARYSLALGDERAYVEREDTGIALGPFGREEQSLSFGGTKSTSVLTKVNNASLSKSGVARREITRKIRLYSDGKIPAIDYLLGDYVFERTGATAESLRVRNIVIEVARDGSVGTAAVTFNDQLLENDIKVAKRLSGISSASAPGTGNGLLVPVPPDETIPNPPTTIVTNSGPYTDNNGFVRSTLNISWTAPTTNTDTSAITDISYYEIRYKKTTSANWLLARTPLLYLDVPNLDPGYQYHVEVRTWDGSGHFSDWTATTTTAALIGDTDAPTQPSTPSMVNFLGTLYVDWDGKDSGGFDMPADFKECQIHVSTTTGFTPTPTTMMGLWTSKNGGTFSIGNVVYGTTYYVKLVAVDTSLNASPASAQVSGVPSRLVTNDITDDAITAAKIAAGAVSATELASSVNDAISTAQSTADGKNTIYYQAAAPTGGTYKANDIWYDTDDGYKMYVRVGAAWTASALGNSAIATLDAGKITTGTLSADRIGTNSITAAKMVAGTITAASGVLADLAVTNAKIDSVAANKLTSGEIQAGAVISAGPTAGTHTEMTASGFSAYTFDPDVGSPVLTGRLGTGNADSLSFRDTDGALLASISELGRGAFTGLSLTDINAGFDVFGDDFFDIINRRARGIVAWIELLQTSSDTTGSELIVLELRHTLEPGRLYKIVLTPFELDVDSSEENRAGIRLRYATGGAAVTTSSTQLIRKLMSPNTLSVATMPGFERLFSIAETVPTEYRFAWTLDNEDGTNAMRINYSASNQAALYIEDVGPALDAASQVIQYTSVWECNLSQAYNADGTKRTDATYLGYSGPNPLTMGDCTGGNNFSIALFTNNAISGETSKTIATALSGATIVKAEIWTYSQYSDKDSGGSIVYRPNTLTAIPDTMTAPGTTGGKMEDNYDAGDARYIDITKDDGGTVQWTAASRGVTFGQGRVSGDTYHNHLRSSYHSTDKPKLRITYRR